MKQVKENKTGRNSEWRIEIYQPIPELELWYMVIWDVWSGEWVEIETIAYEKRLKDEVLDRLLRHIQCGFKDVH